MLADTHHHTFNKSSENSILLKKSISFQHIKHENFMNKSIDSDHVGDSEELMKLDHFSDNEIEKNLLVGKFQKPINHSDV